MQTRCHSVLKAHSSSAVFQERCVATESTIPTEPIGSIPRPVDLIERVAKGDREDPSLAPLYEDAIQDTIERFETTGSQASLLAESEASRRGTTR